MNVENDSHLKKDLDFINAALKAVREACTATDAATMRRTANLARLHVGHAVNAIVTACLSSRLHRLRVQCDDRTRLFGTIPEARKAVTKPTRTDFGLVVKRH